MNPLREQYERDGYYTIPRAFSSKEIAALRDAAKEVFARPVEFEGDRPNIRLALQTRYPKFRLIIKNQNFINGLKQVFGDDFVMFPEESVDHSGVVGGWHKDTGTSERLGYHFHWEPGFNVATIGIYLQDNHEDYAGGLDVVPGSHKKKSSWWQTQKSANRRVKWVLSHLDRRGLIPKTILHSRRGSVSVRHQAGDVVVFNMKIDHRGTHASKTPIPEEHKKYACFLKCGENNKFAPMYMELLRKRPDYKYLDGFTYPQDFLQLARATGGTFIL